MLEMTVNTRPRKRRGNILLVSGGSLTTKIVEIMGGDEFIVLNFGCIFLDVPFCAYEYSKH